MRYFKIVLLTLSLGIIFKIGKEYLSIEPLEKVESFEGYCSKEIKEQDAKDKTIICIPKPAVDFGKVNEKKLFHKFEILNSGDAPLIIKNVKGSGGNMPNKYPRHPIPIGETAEIETTLMVKGLKGDIRKSWTIISNTKPPQSKLLISASLDYCTTELPQKNEKKLTKICMPEVDYQAGEIRPGMLNHSFEIYNNGSYPLIIKWVKPNSGDNTASYPKDPIGVGEKVTLEVKWNTKKMEGKASRRWVLYTNTVPEKSIFTVSANFSK